MYVDVPIYIISPVLCSDSAHMHTRIPLQYYTTCNYYYRRVTTALNLALLWQNAVIKLTILLTIPGLCSLRALAVWNTSTTPSVFSRSMRILMAMKVPVRPYPPLERRERRCKGEEEVDDEKYNYRR